MLAICAEVFCITLQKLHLIATLSVPLKCTYNPFMFVSITLSLNPRSWFESSEGFLIWLARPREHQVSRDRAAQSHSYGQVYASSPECALFLASLLHFVFQSCPMNSDFLYSIVVLCCPCSCSWT